MQDTQVQSLGWEDLEKEMATHFSIPTWEIPWREEPGGLQCICDLPRAMQLAVTLRAHFQTTDFALCLSKSGSTFS